MTKSIYPTKYKILTWNILVRNNYDKRIYNIARFISELKPDIVLLQEIDNNQIDKTLDALGEFGYVAKLASNEFQLDRGHTVGIAYNPNVFTELPGDALDANFGAISLDLQPVDKPLINRPVKYIGRLGSTLESPLDYGNDILTVISYHGSWGTFAQSKRLREIMAIDKFAHNKGNAVILGGDFNANPGEPGVQYLLGNRIIDDRATYWVEVQEYIQCLGGEPPYGTSFTSGPIIDQKNQVSDISRVPERRIDYLFNFGFSYGRQYSFDGWRHHIDLDKARQLSDHAPLIAGLLDANSNSQGSLNENK